MDKNNEIIAFDELKTEFRRRGIPIADRHTHSITKHTNCFDLSKGPPVGPYSNVIEFAARKEFDEFAITDHSYELLMHPIMESRTNLQLKYGKETFNNYLHYLNRVKEKYSNIKVLGGMELKIRTMRDLAIQYPSFEGLDLILIETMLKKPDFKKIRDKFGANTPLILAHPPVDYIFTHSDNIKSMQTWIEGIVSNNFYFDINRQFFDKMLSDNLIYKTFFELALDRGILFSTGSDYHGILGNYDKFFTKLFNIIEKYGLTRKNFVRF